MSLWIVDGGLGFTLPVVARVDDWQEGKHIDVTAPDESGNWQPRPVRYVPECTCHVETQCIKDLEAENTKMRELLKEACEMARSFYNLGGTYNDLDDLLCEAAELGVEVD